MSPYLAPAQIEARAAELWRAHELSPGFDIERLLDRIGLGLSWEEIDDRDAEGDVLGQLIPGEATVVVNERHLERLEKDGGAQLRFTIGHEIAHWHLHAPGGFGSCPLFDGRTVLCRDGSKESIERQAEMFSAALLMPHELVAETLPTAPWSGWPAVYELAKRFAVSPTAMVVRLQGLQWAHLAEDRTPHSGPEPAPSQGSLFDS
jgi:hypothetical protein